jgi:hypothetical protein
MKTLEVVLIINELAGSVPCAQKVAYVAKAHISWTASASIKKKMIKK